MHVALIKILQQIQIILNKLRKSFSRFEDSCYLTTNSTPFTGYRLAVLTFYFWHDIFKIFSDERLIQWKTKRLQ